MDQGELGKVNQTQSSLNVYYCWKHGTPIRGNGCETPLNSSEEYLKENISALIVSGQEQINEIRGSSIKNRLSIEEMVKEPRIRRERRNDSIKDLQMLSDEFCTLVRLKSKGHEDTQTLKGIKDDVEGQEKVKEMQQQENDHLKYTLTTLEREQDDFVKFFVDLNYGGTWDAKWCYRNDVRKRETDEYTFPKQVPMPKEAVQAWKIHYEDTVKHDIAKMHENVKEVDSVIRRSEMMGVTPFQQKMTSHSHPLDCPKASISGQVLAKNKPKSRIPGPNKIFSRPRRENAGVMEEMSIKPQQRKNISSYEIIHTI